MTTEGQRFKVIDIHQYIVNVKVEFASIGLCHWGTELITYLLIEIMNYRVHV